jgi:hypothetical protein
LKALEGSINEFAILHEQLLADISISGNVAWRSKMDSILAQVEDGFREISAMKEDAPIHSLAYATFFDAIFQVEQEMELLLPDYNLALDNQDSAALERVKLHAKIVITTFPIIMGMFNMDIMGVVPPIPTSALNP